MIVKSHNLPLSAVIKDNIAQEIVPVIPNNIIGKRNFSTPPIITGITNDARNTSEKLANNVDKILNFDLVNLNI